MAEEVDNTAEMSEAELAERISSLLGSTPSAEEKQNIHSFLHNVAVAKDTTKTGNLSQEELGTPIIPLRTYKELDLFCREIADMEYYADYFKKKGEILTSTSLSKDAKLLSLAILQKREVADVSAQQPRKENKGWFKKREPSAPTAGAGVSYD